MIYVANYYSDTVSIIDGKTHVVIDEIFVGNTPWGIVADSKNNFIYTTNYFSKNNTLPGMLLSGPVSKHTKPVQTKWSPFFYENNKFHEHYGIF